MGVVSNQLKFPFVGNCQKGNTRLDNTVTSNKELFNIVFKTDPECSTNKRVIFSGHFIETYDYEKPIILNRKPPKKKKPIRGELLEETKKNRKEEYRRRTKARVIGMVQRLVETNFNKDSIFLTLTFNDQNNFDINNLKVCNSKFHNFIVKLRKEFENFKFLAVPEFQKRGAVHYHLIINQSFIKKDIITKFWKYGFIKIKDIYYLEGIGNYFTKYLTKNSDDERLYGKKSFFTSKNFRRPKTVYMETAEKIINRLNEKGIKPFYTNEYSSEFNGVVKYAKYHIDEKI